MKEFTIDILKNDLIKDKTLEESFDKNKDFVYEIEFLPVLTKRDSQGKLQEITHPTNGLVFKCENC